MLWRIKKHTLNTKPAQLLTAVVAFLFVALPAHAQQIDTGLNALGQTSGLGQTDLKTIISNVINIGLGFLGILVVLYMLYGGFLWMTSGGEQEKVTKAKKTIVNAIIGVVIVMSSWSIAYFVLQAIGGATGAINNGGAGGAGGTGGSFDAAALGSGSLESHYPGRNAINIPRNAPIIITFRDPIELATIISNPNATTHVGGVNTNGVKISKKLASGAFGEMMASADAVVTPTADGKTFVIRPIAGKELGTTTDTTTYEVLLTSTIRKADGTNALGINGYRWNFDVSTVLDLTPPQVQSIFPGKGAEDIPRNAIVTVTFNEPLDPTSGMANGALTISDISSGTAVPIAGTPKYSNNYRTIEFVPALACGTSSCGTTVFCLPAGSKNAAGYFNNNIEVKVKPATIDPTLHAPASSLPFDGVADSVGNSLDGNANGTADGPVTDLYAYRFATGTAIRTDPPVIKSITPNSGSGSVAFDAPVKVTFSPFMQFSTLGAGNITLTTTAASVPPYSTDSVNVDPTPSTDPTDDMTVMTISHGLFAENASYQPQIGSGVRDAYQNCFNPVAGPTCTTDADNQFCCPTGAGGAIVKQHDQCTGP